MASIFSHALVAISLGKSYSRKKRSLKYWVLAISCSIIPDADILMFKFGIPYEHFLGHRGFFHSIPFSFILAVVVTAIFYRGTNIISRKGLSLVFFFFLCTASHALLDAMTNGGLGVAFFSPFDNSRYFLPWRPIQVSPIGISNFLSEWGISVIKSEIIWVGLPCICVMIISAFIRKINRKNSTA